MELDAKNLVDIKNQMIYQSQALSLILEELRRINRNG